MIEYKGYVGEFEFDEASGFFYGRVVNTGTSYPIATFMAKEPHRMPEEFRVSIDVYLESCAEDGVEPLPPLPYPDAQTGDQETNSLFETEVVRR